MTIHNKLTNLRDEEAEKLKKALWAVTKGGHASPITQALRARLNGKKGRLRFHFEKAHGLLPASDLPYHFAEALFRLYDAKGNVIPSFDALKSIEAIPGQPDHIASRLRFWMALAQMAEHFRKYPDHTHMSLNISASVAADPGFVERMGKAMEALQASHPGKGLILEMLEHTHWRHPQERLMKAMQAYKVVWAVDDFGAEEGCHDDSSLRLAKKYSPHRQPIVKLDGQLLRDVLQGKNITRFVDHLQKVQRVCRKDGAFLLLEWVKSAKNVSDISQVMRERGLGTLPIHYAQGEDFTAKAARQIMGFDH